MGLFFGSFNPIHIGHLIIAQAMIDYGHLDEVWFVVSPQNPFKKAKSLVHEVDRLRMVELAIEDNDRLKASNIEFGMPRPSYTIDTLTYLTERHPQHDFYLIMGEDNLISFHKWKNSSVILENHGILVYPRPGEKATPDQIEANIQMVEAPLLDISATYVRKCIKNYRSIRYLVPEKVVQFIEDRKLYMD